MTVTSAILNTVLNYTLIPVFGVSGAAYATLISAVSSFLLYTILSYKYYPIPYKTKKLLLAFGLVLICSYLVLNMFDEINVISIILKTIYSIFVFKIFKKI